MGELVREYLEFYSLDYTREIYVPESGLSGKDTRPRERLALDSRIGEAPQDKPLLVALLEKFMSGGQASAPSFSAKKSEQPHSSVKKGIDFSEDK